VFFLVSLARKYDRLVRHFGQAIRLREKALLTGVHRLLQTLFSLISWV
jgi:hypothetical protein